MEQTKTDLYSTAFGQTQKLTAIQMALPFPQWSTVGIWSPLMWWTA